MGTGGISVTTACLPHLTDPARTQPTAPLNPAATLAVRLPPWESTLFHPSPGKEMEIGIEVCQLVQLGRDVKLN